MLLLSTKKNNQNKKKPNTKWILSSTSFNRNSLYLLKQVNYNISHLTLLQTVHTKLWNALIRSLSKYLGNPFIVDSHTVSSFNSHTSASFCPSSKPSSVPVVASVSTFWAPRRSASVIVIGCKGKNPAKPSERERQERKTYLLLQTFPTNYGRDIARCY